MYKFRNLILWRRDDNNINLPNYFPVSRGAMGNGRVAVEIPSINVIAA
jgi:hypothetical protein